VANALIEVDSLNFTYDDGTAALRDVTFRLFPGETVVLLGANGSGKTTFVLHLNGLMRSPAIRVGGEPVTDANVREIRRRIGIVFQDSEEQLFMPTVLEDVAFGPTNMGLDSKQALLAARSALEQTGMAAAESRAPYHLSAGEKRRVAIAGVLAMSPEVLVFDEPTTWLDPPGQRQLVALLRALPQAKIIVTHDIPFAQAVATRAVFFESGRIVAEGSVEDLVERFSWRPE
jgi:cobalt/nickel transport system ATP-binding protein